MPRETRVERNADLFREVNERIGEMEGAWESGDPLGFVCECANLDCTMAVYATRDEFGEARARAGRFLVVPEHADPRQERVVKKTARYALVERLSPCQG
jgi:hypothetical protein